MGQSPDRDRPATGYQPIARWDTEIEAGAPIRTPPPSADSLWRLKRERVWPVYKLGHASIDANTKPTTETAKPAKPITAHPPMPSDQRCPRRRFVIVISRTSAPVTIPHRAPTTNKPTPARYHMPGY